MRYEVRCNVREVRDAIGMFVAIPGTGKVLGAYKSHAAAKACMTRHQKKHPHARGYRVNLVP
jgi:hypothetical protein